MRLVCSQCDSEVSKRDLNQHLESVHTGPRRVEFIDVRCGFCPFATSADDIASVISHCTASGHDARKVFYDFQEFERRENQRLRNIVALGIKLIPDGSKKYPVSFAEKRKLTQLHRQVEMTRGEADRSRSEDSIRSQAEDAMCPESDFSRMIKAEPPNEEWAPVQSDMATNRSPMVQVVKRYKKRNSQAKSRAPTRNSSITSLLTIPSTSELRQRKSGVLSPIRKDSNFQPISPEASACETERFSTSIASPPPTCDGMNRKKRISTIPLTIVCGICQMTLRVGKTLNSVVFCHAVKHEPDLRPLICATPGCNYRSVVPGPFKPHSVSGHGKELGCTGEYRQALDSSQCEELRQVMYRVAPDFDWHDRMAPGKIYNGITML